MSQENRCDRCKALVVPGELCTLQTDPPAEDKDGKKLAKLDFCQSCFKSFGEFLAGR